MTDSLFLHIYIHAYTGTSTVHIYVHIRTYMRACMHACVHNTRSYIHELLTYIYTCIVYIYIYIERGRCIYVIISVCIYVCIYIHAYGYIRVYVFIYLHIDHVMYIYIQRPAQRLQCYPRTNHDSNLAPQVLSFILVASSPGSRAHLTGCTLQEGDRNSAAPVQARGQWAAFCRFWGSELEQLASDLNKAITPSLRLKRTSQLTRETAVQSRPETVTDLSSGFPKLSLAATPCSQGIE